jgi:hypothetical protein
MTPAVGRTSSVRPIAARATAVQDLGMDLPLGWIFRMLLACGVAGLAAAAVLLATQSAAHAAPPKYTAATIGGLTYDAVLGRPVDPANRVDAAITRGLPARYRHLPHGEILYGGFVGVSNPSGRPLASAARIDLRDDDGSTYRPIRLPASNRYAYEPGTIAAGETVPHDDAAARNLAAGGRLLLFRVPAWRYRNGAKFELVVHTPGATPTVEF